MLVPFPSTYLRFLFYYFFRASAGRVI